MAGAGGNKNKAMREAIKALSAAAASLAHAADALSSLCEVDDLEEDRPTGTSGSVSDQTCAPTLPNATPALDYESEESEDEYMTLAKDVIRSAATTLSEQSYHPPGFNPMLAHQNNLRTSVDLDELQSHSFGGPEAYKGMGDSSPEVHRDEPQANTTPKTWADLARLNQARWGTVSETRPFSTGDASSNLGTEDQIPFKNLKNKWAKPTELQLQITEPLRAGYDMLLIHGNLKSQTHAILAHCMNTLKKSISALGNNPIGVISVLIIVPQQTTGRLFLGAANELFQDFGLPCKALRTYPSDQSIKLCLIRDRVVLPGGGSDVNSEAERMANERIDILISSPRVFVNHVNGNPNLSSHLAKLRSIIYAGAQELTRSDTFLSFQFNMIKKRMATRAKSPRQIIITTNGTSEQVEVFTARALKPEHVIVTGSGSGDSPQDKNWDDLLNNVR